MKKTKQKEISIEIDINKMKLSYETDNILDFLRNIDILPDKISTNVKFSVTYNGKTLGKIIRIFAFKSLIMKDINRQILAKYFNQGLGIPIDNYN